MTTKQRLIAKELNEETKLDFIAKTIGTSELPYSKKNKLNSFWFPNGHGKISFTDVQFSSISPKVFIAMQLYSDDQPPNYIEISVKSKGFSDYRALHLKDVHPKKTLTREDLRYYTKDLITSIEESRQERETRANNVRIAYSKIRNVVYEKIVDMLNNVPNFWYYEVIQEVQASAQMLHF